MTPTVSAGRLDRRDLCRAVLADRGGLLVIAGLGAPAWDISAVDDCPENLPLWGGMGGAAMLGLGLALAQPTRRVLVVTGDGEMLMGLGALATIAVKQPSNLAILVLDNEHYGETGMQETHTKHGVDLVAIARGAGFEQALLVTGPEQVLRCAAPSTARGCCSPWPRSMRSARSWCCHRGTGASCRPACATRSSGHRHTINGDAAARAVPCGSLTDHSYTREL